MAGGARASRTASTAGARCGTTRSSPAATASSGLAQRIEIHSPLALVILMLGTNDFQSMHPHDAWHSAQGIAALVTAIRQAPIEPGMPVPPVLVVAPPPIQEPRGPIAPKFAGGGEERRPGGGVPGGRDGARLRVLRRGGGHCACGSSGGAACGAGA